jgi:hypothetical protein
MRRVVSFLFLLMAAAALSCTSTRTTRPATVPQPEIYARLVHPIYFGSGDTAPATIEVRVSNRSQVPLTVRRIEIESPGMRQYTLDRGIRDYREVIPPGEWKALTVFTRAIALTTRTPEEPLMIRAIVEFAAGEAVWREVLMMRQ